jgi:hypothetical protein
MVETEKTTRNRKKRSDRTTILYEILVAGSFSYIGLTVKSQSTINKSVNLRLRKHFERARNEQKSWPLYECIKKYGTDAVSISVIEVVRGKLQAHKREVELIKTLKPVLNLASNG